LPQGMYDDVMSGRWEGSDWVDAFYNKGAITQGHSFNLTGGTDLSKFSIGYSYSEQDGIFGEAVQSKYSRNTFRVNSDHVLLKVRDFDAVKIGQTLNYSYRNRNTIRTGNIYWNDFHDVLIANPLMPIYNEDGGYYDYYDKEKDGWRFDSMFGNPIGAAAKSRYGKNLNKDHVLNTSVYLQIQPIRGLVFKSQFGYGMSGGTYRTHDEIARWSDNANQSVERVHQSASLGYNWTLDNTVTYNFAYEEHGVMLQAGQAVEKWGYGENISSGGSINNFTGLGWDYAWTDNLRPTQLSERTAGGEPWGEGAMASFWGRAMYNYMEKYMITVTMRADGSSNFARGNRWGYFPSVSAGWIMSSESFMDGTKDFLTFLKIMANWGQNGNASVRSFQYLTTYRFPQTALYYFGDTKNTPFSGAAAGRLMNPDISWETSQMLDLGFDARFLNGRLGYIFNHY